ncbi:MAG: MarR family transcriptional regulator [Ktedonobacteraceae bacterium]|nr:MarR family transcriptional regulator [Ktedonobacteraceae bacterium]MBV9713377.1 MarR family transcriptional regulator [Ktedonobacteraceae bacterium]
MRPDDTPGYWLMQTMRSVANAFSDVLQTSCAALEKPYVITPPQWFALSSLAHEEDLPIGTLAQRLTLDASVVTGIVKRLEQHGLLERIHDRTDYRLVRLRLTPEGREITHTLAGAAAAFHQRLLQGVSPEEKEMFLQQLARIRANAHSIREETSYPDSTNA